MSWQVKSVQKEKLRFISDWLGKEYTFTDLCNRYDISRKTGYKLVNRFEQEGVLAFEERSHARHTHPNALPKDLQDYLLNLKSRYPTWGPRKIRDYMDLESWDGILPASSTIGELYKRHGLVNRRKKRRKVPGQNLPFTDCMAPNDLWSADFKGQFRLGNGAYCYPLTISDNKSRYLFACDGFEGPRLKETMKSFERVFREYGLPKAIRTDNGLPFASTGIGALTRLTIWWIKLGIMPERIQPGCPQENGRHERMHRTLKESTANPGERDFNDQQKKFDAFIEEYNTERPHESLCGKRPSEAHERSKRSYPNRIEELVYPEEFLIRKVRTTGQIKWHGKKYHVSSLLHGEPIGLDPIDDGRAIVYFGEVPLGVIDARQDKITRA